MIEVICDLDGVLYRGDVAVSGAPEALRRLTETHARITYLTNNSTRTPAQVASKIEVVTGVSTDPSQVITSSQAAASLLTLEDQPTMVVGEKGVVDALARVGIEITEDPEKAGSVVVGLDRNVTYDNIARASAAVRSGARFLATNTDPTLPTATGFLPGAGSLVAAIATAAGRVPEVAGKPHQAMRDLVKSRGIDEAWVIGDRMDTDVAMATAEPEWSSILVLTGATTSDDDVSAADHVVPDFESAVDLVLSRASRQ
ncbi:MAG: HAD-IIA family hydrolase [Actinobacteria bacterium]|nr:HAD-IIA family hydrolase [Actinomycetota bacterium]